MSADVHTVALSDGGEATFEILDRLGKRSLQLQIAGPDDREWQLKAESTNLDWDLDRLGGWDADGELMADPLPDWTEEVLFTLE